MLDSFDVVGLLNHYDELQNILIERDKQIADLEAKLAELKEKVPQFKVGQECYFINRNFYYSDYAEDLTEEFFIDCSKIQEQQNYYYIKEDRKSTRLNSSH